MKYIFLALILLSSQTVSSQSNSFVLNGKITGKKDGTIYLITWNDDWYRIRDSSEIINGKFQFKGQLSGYNNYGYLKIDPDISENSDAVNGVQIGLENSKMNISLEYNHFSRYILSGCKACDEYDNYEKKSPIEAYEHYCKSNPNSLIATRLIFDNYRSNSDIEKAKSLFFKLSKKLQADYYGKQIKLKIQSKDLEGSPAINFSKIDIKGKRIELYEILKENYVLLEFWGSWCNPCRAEHPDLIRLYQKYHSKGFEIIGISDDDKNPDKWRKAVEDDGVGLWSQILRDKKIDENKNTGNPEDIGNMYFVRAFPTLILIDRQKKVLGKFYNSKELETKLTEIFDK